MAAALPSYQASQDFSNLFSGAILARLQAIKVCLFRLSAPVCSILMQILLLSLGVLALILLLVEIATHCFASIMHKRARILEKSRQQGADRRFLNQFIQKLATVNELIEALSIIVTKVCKDQDAESAGVFVPDEMDPSFLRGASCTGYFPILTVNDKTHSPKIRENARYRIAYFQSEIVHPYEGIIGEVAATRQPILFNREDNVTPRWPIPLEVKTMMVMPLMSEDRFVGVVCAVNRKRSLFPFTEHNLEFFQQLSAQPALACSLIAIYAERRRQDRLNRELEVCAELQQSMLPDIPARLGEYRFAALNRPAFEVSGDFYDFMLLEDNRLLLMVADATGKGLPACLMTSMSQCFVRGLVERYTDMKSFLLDVNRLIYANTDNAHFLTVNLLLIDLNTHTCEFGCAGHTPLLRREADGTCTALKPTGPALGMWPNDFPDLFETMTFTIKPGTRFCLYTDGLTEALNRYKEEFGQTRMMHEWQKDFDSIQEAAEHVFAKVKTHAGEVPQTDDQTIIAFSREPVAQIDADKNEPEEKA